MNILGTGLSGLVGSRIVDLFSPEHSFENLSLETGVDITNANDIKARISKSDALWVFHFAAYTNVQGAEQNKEVAKAVNVTATENIVSICKETGKHLVYIDTDYAFDGKKKTGYTEDDTPSPEGWYACTKSEGAKRVLAYQKGLVIRISNPYRANPVGLPAQPGKTDFVHKMLERLTNKQEILAPTDQLFVPTFIDDIAVSLEKLMSVDASGIYHVVGSPLSPFEAATHIAQTYGCNVSLVKSTTFAEYFKDRAPSPQYAVLKNEKITSLGISLHDFESGVKEIYRQEVT